MNKDELKAFRREMISRMEQRLAKSRNPEDDLFYCHPSEDRIVLSDKDARKFGAICIVAAGYGGDMPGAQADELLDDFDFLHNRVKCRKIESLLPMLNGMVAAEQLTL